ncbi:MAG: hypothetical protein WAM85_19580 [Terracidiphilus sp.]
MKRTIFFIVAALLLLNTPARRLAAEAAATCATNPDARQLDFWLGDWSVASPGMAGKGHSIVYLSLDKCLLIETWGSDTSNHNGENALAYNNEDKRWYGLFVDNKGRVHMMKGSVAPGVAEFQGPGRDEKGAEVLKRVRVVRVDPDHVEQIWEKSVNRGASWATEFKMEYVRRKR